MSTANRWSGNGVRAAGSRGLAEVHRVAGFPVVGAGIKTVEWEGEHMDTPQARSLGARPISPVGYPAATGRTGDGGHVGPWD